MANQPPPLDPRAVTRRGARARRAAAVPAAAACFTITDLAREFDITARAIRFYEDMGLLTPARAGRNRVYTQRDRTRLKLTLRGKRLGLSLAEVKRLVDMYDSPADTAPQLQAFLLVLQDHREQLQRQLDDLQIMLAEIAQHEERCHRLLAAPRALPPERRASVLRNRPRPRKETA